MEIKNILLEVLKKKQPRYVTLAHLRDNYPTILAAVESSTKFLPNDIPFTMRMWCWLNDVTELPKCVYCGNTLQPLGIKDFWKHTREMYFHRFCSASCSTTYATKDSVAARAAEVPPKCAKDGCDNPVKRGGNGKWHAYCSSKCSANSITTVEKRDVTLEQKYGKGVTNVFQSSAIKEKIKQTSLEHFGTENPAQSNAVREKMKLTSMTKYGVANPACCSKVMDKIKLARWENTYENFSRFSDKVVPAFPIEDWHGGGNAEWHPWTCVRCGLTFLTWYDNGRTITCPTCDKPDGTGIELYIEDILKEAGITYAKKNRTVISPLELDFWIPSKNFAIEVNGLYWHSDAMQPDDNYHINKTKSCEKAGVQLIHIFEDEINKRPKMVRARLRSMLGITTRTIYARECEVQPISKDMKNKFVSKYHAQGNDKSQCDLGLFFKKRLVAVMTFCKPRLAMGMVSHRDGVYELSRYVTISNFRIIGGAGKLIKHFQRTTSWSEIYSYADRRWNSGKLYEVLGMKKEKETKPNYWYLEPKTMKRIHRFAMRKSELPRILSDKFDPSLSERENTKRAGWLRIYDCGSFKYVLKNKDKK